MGKGRGIDINVDFILRLLELILLCIAVTLYFIGRKDSIAFKVVDYLFGNSLSSLRSSDDALIASTAAFFIMLMVIVGLQLFKSQELEAAFMGPLAVVGAILLISTGICVCILYITKIVLISGIVAIAAGGALIAEALLDFGVISS